MAEEKFQYALTLATQATGNGAKQTADELNRVRSATAGAEDAMERLGAQAPRTAAQIDKVADSTKQLGTSSSYNKAGANAGQAVLEASRAFEDLQFGLRGLLNNIPSLIFALGGSAGLAGVISVLAVGGSVLWNKFSGGANKAKEDTEDLLETFKQLVEVYGELDQTNAEDRAKAAADAAKGLQEAINTISLGQIITGNRAGIQAARDIAAENLQLAQDRARLAEVEKAVTLASGQDAVRLAQEREAIIGRILESEFAITEANRQREIAIAKGKVDAAAGKVDATKQSDDVLAAQARELQAQYNELRAAAEEETRIRVAAAKRYSEELDVARAALAARSKELELDPNRIEILAPFEAAVKRLQSIVNSISGPTPGEVQKFAEAEIPFNALKELQPALDSSAEAQREAARAMTEASLALSNISQSQDIARQSEGEIRATQEIARVGQDVTQAARDAIAAIIANAAQQGRGVSAGEQEAIGRAQQILNDTTPDAGQGGQLAGILQSLSNNLNAKDQVLSNGLNQIITTTKNLASKYQGLSERISDVQNQVNQIK